MMSCVTLPSLQPESCPGGGRMIRPILRSAFRPHLSLSTFPIRPLSHSSIDPIRIKRETVF